MSLAYAPGAVDRARKEGLYLLKLSLNGRHAKRGRIEITGPIGPKTAARLRRLCIDLASPTKRMK